MTSENRDSPSASPHGELVSVVVPAWNAEATLARALRSALAQDYPNIEVIVVDDGSTDGTRTVVEEFVARVTSGEFASRAVPRGPAACSVGHGRSATAATEPVGTTEPLKTTEPLATTVRLLARPHAGASAARNAGIAEARGEFIAFLDADDEWLPGYLRRGLEPMLHDAFVGMTWCRALRRTPDGRETIFGQAFDRAKPFRDRLWPPAEQCTPATICRAEALRRVREPDAPPPAATPKAGPFDESLATREDQDLWIRMRELAGVVAVPDALVVVHARGRAGESGRDWARIRADYFAILERALARRPDLYGPHRREIRAEADWHWGLMALKSGDCGSARRALWRSFLTAPRLRTLPPALASLLPERLLRRLLRRKSSGQTS